MTDSLAETEFHPDRDLLSTFEEIALELLEWEQKGLLTASENLW